MSEIPLHLLPKSHRGKQKTNTFVTVCEENKKIFPTDAWLVPNKIIFESKRTLSKIITSTLQDHQLVVKIQRTSPESKNEVEINQILQKTDHPNISETICSFDCPDQMILYREDSLPGGYCNLSDKSDSVTIIITPYYSLGNLEDFPLDRDDAVSIMLQVSCALMELHLLTGLTHNDLILGNIFIKPTSMEFISYFDDKINVKTNGLLAIISDFGLSRICKNVSMFTEPMIVQEIYVLCEYIVREHQLTNLPFDHSKIRDITGFQELIKFYNKNGLFTQK